MSEESRILAALGAFVSHEWGTALSTVVESPESAALVGPVALTRPCVCRVQEYVTACPCGPYEVAGR